MAPRSRGSGRSCACSAPRRCAAAAARREGSRSGARRSAAQRRRLPWAHSRRPVAPAPWENRAPWPIDFEARGAAEGDERQGPRGAAASCSRSWPATASRSRSCGGRSRRTGWRCCPSSGCSRGRGRATPPPRSPSGSASSWSSCGAAREALGLPDPGATRRHSRERDVEAAKRIAALRDAGLPDEGMLEVARVIGMAMAQVAAASRRAGRPNRRWPRATPSATSPGASPRARAVCGPLIGPTARVRARPPPARADPAAT